MQKQPMRRHRWLYIVGVSALLVSAALGVSLYSSPRPEASPPSPSQAEPVKDEMAKPGDKETAPTLPVAEREFLWEVEHHGNLLSSYGFSALADALRRADASALTALLATDFAGGTLQQP